MEEGGKKELKGSGLEPFVYDPMITQKIETLVKVLGTMVMKPQYETNPNEIGGKHTYTGMLQTPIVNSNYEREIILQKLYSLIAKL